MAKGSVEQPCGIELSCTHQPLDEALVDAVRDHKLPVAHPGDNIGDRARVDVVGKRPFEEHQTPVAGFVERACKRAREPRIGRRFGEHGEENWLSIGRCPECDIEVAKRPCDIAMIDGILDQPQACRKTSAAEAVGPMEQLPRLGRLSRNRKIERPHLDSWNLRKISSESSCDERAGERALRVGG